MPWRVIAIDDPFEAIAWSLYSIAFAPVYHDRAITILTRPRSSELSNIALILPKLFVAQIMRLELTTRHARPVSRHRHRLA
jgi:hypothetical protein